MPEDFGTVNANRAQRAREIEVMRAHYRRHREALVSMSADAPTEGLANAYQSLIGDIDRSLTKLDDLERGVSTPVVPAEPPIALKTEPAQRPLAHQPHSDVYGGDDPTYIQDGPAVRRPGGAGGRLIAMILLGLLVLGAVGWMVWRSRGERTPDNDLIVEDTATATDTSPTTNAPATATVAAEAPEVLTVTPASHDYGAIRKGTRATRQFEIRNDSDTPMTVAVSRSACRCLYYEYKALIPPKTKESLTVTIDGGRAKSGTLNESIRVTEKNDATLAASFQVSAEIR